MAWEATLSIMGLYNYDNTIFDYFQIPTALTKDVLIDELMIRYAELEVIYPNPDIMKVAISNWSRIMLPIWNKLYETTQFDYNPIYNTDRHLEWQEGYETKRTRGFKEKSTVSGKEKQKVNENTNGTDNSKNTHSVAGFNSTDMVESTHDVNERTTTNDRDSTVNVNNSANGTRNTKENENIKNNHKHVEESYGNIGVTTTQQMIREEREVVQFNLYDIIIEDFKKRFLIMVW